MHGVPQRELRGRVRQVRPVDAFRLELAQAEAEEDEVGAGRHLHSLGEVCPVRVPALPAPASPGPVTPVSAAAPGPEPGPTV